MLKVKHRTAFMTSNAIHRYTPERMKSRTPEDICTSVLIAALFTVARRQKQPKCSSIDECTTNVHIMEYYLTIKKNGALIHAISDVFQG